MKFNDNAAAFPPATVPRRHDEKTQANKRASLLLLFSFRPADAVFAQVSLPAAVQPPVDFPRRPCSPSSPPPDFPPVYAQRGPPLISADKAARRGREGDPGRPQGGRSAGAGADIARPEGAGRFAPTPHATRGGRGTVGLERGFPRPGLRGVGGCGGCRGVRPLSPPAPRRAGDLPPAPGNSSDSRKKK